MEDLTETDQLIVLDEALVLLNLADQGLADIHAQQLQLGGQLFLGEPPLFSQLPETSGDEIGFRILAFQLNN